MNNPPVLTHVQDGIGTITLNRPEARNALSKDMRQGIAAAVVQMRDDESVQAVIITGAGGAFCSGGDVIQMVQSNESGLPWRERIRALHQWFPELVNLQKPVIAAVDGPAFGAGFSIALAADFILASKRAQFCAVFGRIGLIPDLGAMQLLPRIVGQQRAKELVFTARTLGAAEARELGIVYEIHEDGPALQTAAQALATRFKVASTPAIGMAKTIMNQAFELDARAMSELEAYAQTMCRGSEYHQRAVQRFRDKQPLLFDWDRPAK
ncbi:enoyl-CoA hydratase/isomerase family protein [Diaphorobacter caeni]|uniref:enoyl-CoA hydratase/isomerase family protein n=1 Tax=Diaphorobacter caeni TaxID=2784387 RepID=UPI00188DD8E2|nr:enoyl-CoA hydratase/isomerase family protein [Diaphorobacter caeni]MBF5006701.1 enoyl-CoA hydratase/isomerase family protein [Diaphorobacter caeni]